MFISGDLPDMDINGKNDITSRKKRHLEICLNSDGIESGSKHLFNEIDFVHNALPEINADEINTGTRFLNAEISLPLMISCMTGGSAEGFSANRELALAAEEMKIPVGMGSFRILLEKPDLKEHFNLKKYAPSVPVIGNIGLIQLRDADRKRIIGIGEDLGIDAIAVHVNPGQEFFQPEGDRDFRGLKESLAEFIPMSSVPVIVKETGCGFDPETIAFFHQSGAAYIDLAGAGGTSWISVERERQSGFMKATAQEFAEWGIPAAVSLYLNQGELPLIASGGIKCGMDAVKAVSMGASLSAMAGPFIKAVKAGGEKAAIELVRSVEYVFRGVMALTGCLKIDQLKLLRLLYSDKFKSVVSGYKGIFNK